MASGSGLLIYNAASGSAQAVAPERLLAALGGGNIDLHEIREGDQPHAIAARAVESGRDWIAVAGGDGTVEDVARVLLSSNVTLGVIPCGTYNNFARNLGLPEDPLEACDVIVSGQRRKIDVGYVDGEPFFECVGIGLDAALFPASEEIKSGRWWKALELLWRASSHRAHRFHLEFDRSVAEALNSPRRSAAGRKLGRIRGREITLNALLLTISNGPYYGMNFAVAPGARVDDGHLTVSVFRNRKVDLFSHYFAIRRGRRAITPEAVTFRVKNLRISGSQNTPMHADGNLRKSLPVNILIEPKILQIFCNKIGGKFLAGETKK